MLVNPYRSVAVDASVFHLERPACFLDEKKRLVNMHQKPRDLEM
jgi:hypothetical protein